MGGGNSRKLVCGALEPSRASHEMMTYTVKQYRSVEGLSTMAEISIGLTPQPWEHFLHNPDSGRSLQRSGELISDRRISAFATIELSAAKSISNGEEWNRLRRAERAAPSGEWPALRVKLMAPRLGLMSILDMLSPP